MAVAVSAGVMLAVGLWGLRRGSVWRDEVATYVAAQRTAAQLWGMLHNVDAVHGLYYLGMHVWSKLANGEVWMRLPSVLASAVSAGMVAGLGARLSGVRVGLTAGLMFAAIPFVSFYAQEARSFALVSACVLAATYFLMLALSRGRGWWPAYAAVVTVASLLNEIAALALVAHAATLLLGRVSSRIWWRWASCAAVCMLAVTPLVLVSSHQSEQVIWLPSPDLEMLGNLGQLFLGPHPATIVLTVALIIAGIIWRPPGPQPGLLAVAAPLVVVPPLLLILASLIHPLFHPRYVLFAVAGIPLLAALGLEGVASRLGRGRRGWLVNVAIGMIVAAIVVTEVPQLRFVRTPGSRADDLAAAAEAIRLNARPGDAVLFVPGLYRLTALGYPQAFAGLNDLVLQQGPTEGGNLTGTDLDIPHIGPAMRAVDQIWVIGRPNLDVRSYEVKSRAKHAVLTADFRRVRVIHVTGLDVALYQRTRR